MKCFFITTPIYYLNDKPHLGHTYTTLAADILSRYFRTKQKVFFLTGTDEHGLKNYKTALKHKLRPKEFCDQMSQLYQKTWKDLEINYDFFIRTTDPFHEEFVKRVLSELKQRGVFYEGEYEGYYCEGCEEFKNKKDLVKGKCPIHQTKAIKLKEKNWFFRLSRFQEEIKKHIGENLRIRPSNREKEVLSFLEKEKLQDIAISRPKERVKWGIELPWDKNQLTYVWVDALLNYLSGPLASKGFNFKNKSWEEIQEAIADFWPADWQLIGKDILRFHAVIWPALLLSLELPLPKNIFAHGFFTIEGQKMSKTLKNVVSPLELKKQYGLASVRYYLFKEFAFGRDGDFSLKNLKERYNSDLAHNIGNLFSRTLALIKKYPSFKAEIEFGPNPKIENLLKELRFRKTLTEINNLAQEKNQLIDKTKPWELIKEAAQGQEFSLRNQAQEKLDELFKELFLSLQQIAHYLSFFLPDEGEKLKESLKTREKQIVFPKIEE